jgi:predicted nucleic acid-binding protein
MKPRRVYIDTSVVGGCLDAEFRDASVQLFEQFRSGDLIAVVSNLTLFEIGPAPAAVRAVLEGIPTMFRENVAVTDDADRLAELYIAAGVIGRARQSDAEHIATATVYEVDVLVSWNFKHIVNEQRIHGYNLVNLREGRPLIEIQTPAEVIAYGR